MTNSEWEAMGDQVCSLLHTIYVKERATFMETAAARGCPLESLAAAAIVGCLHECMEGKRGKRMPGGRRP